MKFRKLRVAWSVVWGIAAVLFVALWVRSYWRVDGLTARDAGRELVLFVEHGDFGASYDGLPKWSRLDLRWDSGSANPGFHMPGLAGFYCGATRLVIDILCCCFHCGLSHWLLPS